MVFLQVVAALAVIQILGSASFLHRDAWFSAWCERVKQLEIVHRIKGLAYLASLLPPLLVLWALLVLLDDVLWGLGNVLLSLLILLYSFGRGEFTALVNAYLGAAAEDDWNKALVQARELGVEARDDDALSGWGALHQATLLAAGYKGLERMFAVLCWFIVLGPLGAVAYRLTQLYLESDKGQEKAADRGLVEKILWLMEWPVVRVLGFSFALTGNFMGCMRHWRGTVLCVERPTKKVLSNAIRGALCIDDEGELPEEVQIREMKALVSLFSRTLVSWLCVLALAILLV